VTSTDATPETVCQCSIPTSPVTAETFAPYGRMLAAQRDGTTMSVDEGALDLSAGTPRFYVMELSDGRSTFTRITRHRQVTQVLAPVGGQPWWLAVAPPCPGSAAEAPMLADIVGFDIPGDVAILLHRGTWHAGPFFEPPRMSFFNLELTDTNVVDHDTSRLDCRFGVECWFDRSMPA
jgi:ureidoglycolate lyase